MALIRDPTCDLIARLASAIAAASANENVLGDERQFSGATISDMAECLGCFLDLFEPH